MVQTVQRALPNGLSIAEINKYETQFLYKEIFVDEAYVKHGIAIEPGDVVLDVGANIGLFALFCLGRAEGVRVIAYEPAPHCLACLRENVRDHADRVTVRDVAVGDAPAQVEFTYYPNYSIMSGTRADAEEDLAILKRGALHQLGSRTSAEEADRMADMLVRGKISGAERFLCDAVTLSDEIDALGVAAVGLLKIDIEKAEGMALAGIADRHWPFIRQVVVEAHDLGGGEHHAIVALLEAKGFQVTIDSSDDLSESNLYNVYARRAG